MACRKESRIAAIRAAQRGEGRSLTHKQAHALAGQWYLWFTGRHEENPCTPAHWDNQLERLFDELQESVPDSVRAPPQCYSFDFSVIS